VVTRRALSLGCGGTLGFAWSTVALAEIEKALDWDAREATVLVGTSAGAELAAFLGSGIATAELLAALDGQPADPRVVAHLATHLGMVPPIPALSLPGFGLVAARVTGRVDTLAGLAGLLPRGRGDAGWLRDLGDALTNDRGWVAHPATWLMGAGIRTGKRVAFGSAEAPPVGLGDAIAASWAIPGWFPPVSISGVDYVDGGTVSPTSADLLVDSGVDEVVIVAPMSTEEGAPGHGVTRIERLARSAMTRRVDAEARLLGEAGVRVIRVEPGAAELEAMGSNFMDVRRRPAVLEAARTLTPARVRAAVTEGALT
jgi:NTE family protein